MIRINYLNGSVHSYSTHPDAGIICVEYDKYSSMKDIYPIKVPRIQRRLALGGTFLSQALIKGMLDDNTKLQVKSL